MALYNLKCKLNIAFCITITYDIIYRGKEKVLISIYNNRYCMIGK